MKAVKCLSVLVFAALLMLACRGSEKVVAVPSDQAISAGVDTGTTGPTGESSGALVMMGTWEARLSGGMGGHHAFHFAADGAFTESGYPHWEGTGRFRVTERRAESCRIILSKRVVNGAAAQDASGLVSLNEEPPSFKLGERRYVLLPQR